jgi:hypothetical protein
MGWLIFLGIIVVVWLWGKYDEIKTEAERDRTNSPSFRSEKTDSRTGYRPKTTQENKKIIFSEISNNGARQVNTQDLSGLKDAFTGADLNPSLGLYQCKNCTVYYHTQSYVSCSSREILKVSTGEHNKGRNFNPDVITLDNFKQHVGRVVTFEGYVHKVLVSKRGSDYAVMFQNTSWTKGFKLVFFKGSIRAVGGRNYIMGLSGKTLKVRGLLINHERFGYEIIVSEKSMILDAK